MRIMKSLNKYLALAVFGGMLTFLSCETTELDIRDNPNALTPEQASVDFFLNSIQEDFVRMFEGDADFDNNDNFQSGGAQNGDGFNLFGNELTRLINMNGRQYVSAFQNIDVDDEWDNTYRGILADIRAMTPLAVEAELTHHIGIAQFIEAFTMMTMVDMIGDVPYSEAIQGADGVFAPGVDPGADIYAQMIDLLNDAIANFRSSAAAEPANDFFYGNDYDAWERAANTLKLRAYLQTRLVDPGAITAFNQIISSGNYIQSTDQDFVYNWPATSATNPDTRHPRYGLNYQAAGANDYQSNWLMQRMGNELDDPRTRYYFYRQSPEVPGATGVPPNEETLNCSLQSPPPHYVAGGFTFCWLDNGFWGRDHGDSEGIPPDGLLRATFGTYPFGGTFDDDSFSAIGLGTGAGGTGITNMLTAFSVDFWRAEIALAQGDVPSASAFLRAGFDKQMAKVQAFLVGREAGADVSFEPTAAEITSYIDSQIAAFDGGTMDERWNILGEQFFFAHFGMGVDAYNFYRRTLYPTTLQPNREPDPGTFIMSLYYPADAVNNNSNISQKANQAVQVFWDNSGVPPAN